MRRGKRQEARGNSKGIGGDSANLKNKCFKCVLAYHVKSLKTRDMKFAIPLNLTPYYGN
ncbi:unknown protein [Microcystis aeruginosa NIES-843]|uniref:Uncharacterized protein n=1 Tax=Microcystis aeruginosa (strain NIES-843 / IAM M-2473) TaxID=449447 RepID=B0JS29_MICAN|nr:unknown protein [Microcystis aeruginosa NIES-843]